MKQLICPISSEKINEKITRLNAFLTILLVISGFAVNSVFFFLFLLVDFYIRAFTKLSFSPIGYVSNSLSTTLNLREKCIDKAPKIFAARMGFIITLLVTILFVFDFQIASMAVGAILVFFAGLESFFSICAGCIIYSYLVLPFYK